MTDSTEDTKITSEPQTNDAPDPEEDVSVLSELERTTKDIDDFENPKTFQIIYIADSVVNGLNLNSPNSAINTQQPLPSANLGSRKQTTRDKTKLSEKEHFFHWFNSLITEEQVFILSVAVFSGNNIEYMVRASDNLKTTLGQQTNKTESSSNSILGSGLNLRELITSDYIKIITVRTGDQDDSYESIGFSSVETKRLIFDLFETEINLVNLRAELLEWLIVIVNKDSRSLNIMGSSLPELCWSQAGIGIGIIIRNDLNSKMRWVVDSWAISPDFRLRLMVGWIFLGVLAYSPGVKFEAIALHLLDWAKNENSYLRWTAIATLSKLCFLSSEENPKLLLFSLDLINRALSDSSYAVRRAANITVRTIYRYSWFHATKIILTLANWLDSDDHIKKDNIAEAAIAIFNAKISSTPTGFSQSFEMTAYSEHKTIWDYDGFVSSNIHESVISLWKQCLVHRKGSFVKKSIDSLVECLIRVGNSHSSNSLENAKIVCQGLFLDPLTSIYMNHIFNLSEIKGTESLKAIFEELGDKYVAR